ncbi:hypothetical protein FB45DRAFT_945724 [Roridomyces roridus]|uniref:Uncharacterized protein n=1 Tax=Roridomyces roridus TaxID=1738132 RepID=A0AAD7B2N2_9AGAR|nr:hypothetical protein FB45DRAFT_945724 [Roridomyces roridus]
MHPYTCLFGACILTPAFSGHTNAKARLNDVISHMDACRQSRERRPVDPAILGQITCAANPAEIRPQHRHVRNDTTAWACCGRDTAVTVYGCTDGFEPPPL